MKSRILKEFKLDEIFTEYIYSLMQEKKNFMVFTDNKQILIEDEIDEWNLIHGLTNITPRIMYKYIAGKGYSVKYTNDLVSLMIPSEEICNEYTVFINKVKEDLDEYNK